MTYGDVLNIGTPSDGTVNTTATCWYDAVTTAKIADNNVTVAKLPTTMDLSSNTVTLDKNASSLVDTLEELMQFNWNIYICNY